MLTLLITYAIMPKFTDTKPEDWLILLFFAILIDLMIVFSAGAGIRDILIAYFASKAGKDE